MNVVTEVHSRVDVPPRYLTPWRKPFEEIIAARLREGMTVLDVGSGRKPTLPLEGRPPNTNYVGLDLSERELRLAGPGAYDDVVVADLSTPVSGLVGTVDLAISWQVFEHVKSLDRAFANLHSYLRRGGSLITLFSGKWSAFGVMNQLLPNAIGNRLVERTMRRRGSSQPVFPAYYDHCSDRALRRISKDWSSVEIIPYYRAANYFHFSRFLTCIYLAYENAAHRAQLRNLATHYLLVARR